MNEQEYYVPPIVDIVVEQQPKLSYAYVLKCEQGFSPGRESLRLALVEMLSAEQYEDILNLFNGSYDNPAATGDGPGSGAQFEQAMIDDYEHLRFLLSEYQIRSSVRLEMDIVDLTTSIATDKLMCFGYSQLIEAQQSQRANSLLEDALGLLMERIGTARTEGGLRSKTAQSLKVVKLLAHKAYNARPAEGAKEQEQWCNALARRIRSESPFYKSDGWFR